MRGNPPSLLEDAEGRADRPPGGDRPDPKLPTESGEDRSPRWETDWRDDVGRGKGGLP